MALLSMRADKFWKKTKKKISIQETDVAGFNKSKVECFNCHKMGYFTRECRAPRSQDRRRRDNYRQGSKVEEQAPKALMAIDGVFDNSLCSKDCKKNTNSLNSKITDLTDKLFDAKNMIYHYKLGLVQVESRLVEHKDREIKYYEKFRGLEFKTEFSDDYIEILKKELETLKKEKEGLDGKLASVVPPPPAQIYSFPKKDMSWTSLLEFKDDTVINYSRPVPTIEISPDDAQNRNPYVTKTEASISTISPKSFIKFVKANDSPTKSKIEKAEKAKKSPVKSAGHRPHGAPMRPPYRSAGHRPHGDSMRPSHTPAGHRPHGPLMNPMRPNMNGRNFKLLADANILLRTPRQHNMRLGHLNVKTMNKLVRHNLVRGLPTKSFDNDHTCTACMKGKHHKASCKSKLVNSVTKPLHTLHMDLFGPTSGSSQNNFDDKGYWDSGCFRHMIGNISYLSDFEPFDGGYVSFGQGGCKITGKGTIKTGKLEFENVYFVKNLKCDNGGEFRNKEMNDFCLQKGIKREFTNARTPQQNGVAERRNRTLIEAARTMLADAKLSVTFWAKAVNTACYVQNRVLVNKSQNKTPYELLNGKFEAKGDEGYFIGYSMSSKSFRVFNKRTRRVEENLHVEFLENKAIEKGAGLNWLFDIDSLIKSMNYVPVDAESSSSKPQDDCSADVPESSRNSNPTATSTNPLADQLETLIVETPISTVSSPVLTAFPTACLNDSLEPSSDTRLILKRVANQVKTPSLDNILALTNWFEDILGVTTNSDESNEVEADVSNMETTITASPTLTLRIHKDHLKSQIIGLVDTLIQTRNKSKENVWTLVDCPTGVRPIGTKRVLKNKKDMRGIVIRNKSRLVAQGHTQEEGIDYDEDLEFPAKVYKVKKAMYGLHQAPRAWYGTLSKYLLTNGFQRGMINQTLFIRRYQVTPKECHLHTVKRIFRYLKGHLKLGLWYPKESLFDLVAYSDSDYSGATQDRKSTTGGCQFLGRRLISWQCKKQTIVATSTTEAEYVAAASCYRQVM
nr:hypothetical protein [Tanacetum cinerariifolium]